MRGFLFFRALPFAMLRFLAACLDRVVTPSLDAARSAKNKVQQEANILATSAYRAHSVQRSSSSCATRSRALQNHHLHLLLSSLSTRNLKGNREERLLTDLPESTEDCAALL